MLILPMLKRLKVSILYLLPIFSCSDRYKKGGLGSPYAVKDIYRLDSGLHDPLLGDYFAELLEIEFKAFVEACHASGIKVIVDFAFRTVARDNVLIARHPDWFFWIKSEFDDEFKPPMIGDGEKSYCLNEKVVRRLYKSPQADGYLSRFTLPPDKINAARWENIKSRGPEGIEEQIRREFGVTTVPGFSDVVNDRQPAWTDVTYLKFYFDNPPEIQKYIPKNQPPYIMQDGASLNCSHGKEKNAGLWDYVAGVLPFYKKNYRIDGARIDMAHALPAELNALMIEKVRETDGKFILWSEEFDPAKGAQARNDGFDFISGYSYSGYKKIKQAGFNKAILQDGFLKSELPLAASAETPDTPRAAQIHKNPDLLRLIVILNNFMPNSVPLICGGQELMEIQPMNLGIDNDESGRFVLPRNDPMYGKLAFFDEYCLHWKNDGEFIGSVLRDTLGIRKDHLPLITGKRNFVQYPELFHDKKLTALCYYCKACGDGLIIAANRSENTRALLNLKKLLPSDLSQNGRATIIYDKNGICERPASTGKSFYLNPSEALIIELKNL
jgi:starch synthase (maltosyl-transferring)